MSISQPMMNEQNEDEGARRRIISKTKTGEQDEYEEARRK